MTAMQTPPAETTSDREIVISRTIKAPRRLVWEAWTDERHISEWWGPNGFTTTTSQRDLRPGGVWRFTMHGPDGTDYPNHVVFHEVVPEERLVYQHSGEGETDDVSFLATVTFEDVEGGTKVTLRSLFPTPERRAHVIREYGAVEGGVQTLSRLAEHVGQRTGTSVQTMTLALPTEREIWLTRSFDAPRRLVFEACTQPEHVKRWWGGGNGQLSVCEIDLRPGGAWRYVLRSDDGEFPFKGVYREVTPPSRLEYTLVFDVEPFNASEAVVTVTFEEQDGRTTITERIVHPTPEARDGHLCSGMEVGAAASFDELAGLLATIR